MDVINTNVYGENHVLKLSPSLSQTEIPFQQTFNYSKSTIKTLKKGVKQVQSQL